MVHHFICAFLWYTISCVDQHELYEEYPRRLKCYWWCLLCIAIKVSWGTLCDVQGTVVTDVCQQSGYGMLESASPRPTVKPNLVHTFVVVGVAFITNMVGSLWSDHFVKTSTALFLTRTILNYMAYAKTSSRDPVPNFWDRILWPVKYRFSGIFVI